MEKKARALTYASSRGDEGQQGKKEMKEGGKERVKQREKDATSHYRHIIDVSILPGRHTLVNGGCVVAAGDLLEEENKGLVNILGSTRTQEKVGMYSKCAVCLQLSTTSSLFLTISTSL